MIILACPTFTFGKHGCRKQIIIGKDLTLAMGWRQYVDSFSHFVDGMTEEGPVSNKSCSSSYV